MAHNPTLQRYGRWYAQLVQLYPPRYRERYGQGMVQTFRDLCRERFAAQQPLFFFAVWLFAETAVRALYAHTTPMTTQSQRIVRLAVVVGLILLIPVFGNLYVEGWNWEPFDFVVAGVLLFGTGLAYELLARRSANALYRAAVFLALMSTFLLAWVVGAVGVIGEENPGNALYGLVVLALLVGAVIARFKPRGMARALTVVAVLQALVPVVAVVLWPTDFAPGVVRVFILNGAWVAMFGASAFLFFQSTQTTTA